MGSKVAIYELKLLPHKGSFYANRTLISQHIAESSFHFLLSIDLEIILQLTLHEYG